MAQRETPQDAPQARRGVAPQARMIICGAIYALGGPVCSLEVDLHGDWHEDHLSQAPEVWAWQR